MLTVYNSVERPRTKTRANMIPFVLEKDPLRANVRKGNLFPLWIYLNPTCSFSQALFVEYTWHKELHLVALHREKSSERIPLPLEGLRNHKGG